MGVENGMFKSEIGSGFEDTGGTPPPRIPRSTPPPRGVSEGDAMITKLTKCVNDLKAEEELRVKEAENVVKNKEREELLRFERAQLEQKLEFEKKIEESKKNQAPAKLAEAKGSETRHTKLPKLNIAKFNGSHTDWLRFWNIFEAEVDKCSDLAGVTKFAYLKDLLEPKIRASIDGLPFSSEGYGRAKSILKNKYGRTSEIVNAYVQNIMALPSVSGSNPVKIHQFYDKLLFNVQALETLGRLQDVNGYVRMSLDKLEAIRGDLVRTDDDWQDWDFPKFVTALRKWTEEIQFPSSRLTRARKVIFREEPRVTHSTTRDKRTGVPLGVFIAKTLTTSRSSATSSLTQLKGERSLSRSAYVLIAPNPITERRSARAEERV